MVVAKNDPMDVPIVPVRKESYFTHVDTLIQSPDEAQLLVHTNLRKQYLLDVKRGILSSSEPSQLVSPNTGRKVHCCERSAGNGTYGLATSDGLCFGAWNDLVRGDYSKQVLGGNTFYSASWIGNSLLAGGDDGKLVEVDGVSGNISKAYTAHAGSVNVVKTRDSNTFVSAGFDGICRVWDRRSGAVEQRFTPSAWNQAKRSKHGSHIMCLDVLDDWIVCGGGPDLSLWYLKEDSGIALLNMEDSIPSVVRFVQDTIIAGGNSSFIRHWNLSGNLKYKVSSKLDTVTDLIVNTESRELPMILAAGSPTELNVFLDAGYLSHTVSFLV